MSDCLQHLWKLQQRDCPGFTPDSLLITSFDEKGSKPMRYKDNKEFDINNTISSLWLK